MSVQTVNPSLVFLVFQSHQLFFMPVSFIYAPRIDFYLFLISEYVNCIYSSVWAFKYLSPTFDSMNLQLLSAYWGTDAHIYSSWY